MVVSIIDKNTVRKKNGSAGWKKGSILHRVVWMKPSEENSWAKTWRRWGGSEPYGCLREEETIGRKSLNFAVWGTAKRPLWQKQRRQREERRLAGLAGGLFWVLRILLKVTWETIGGFWPRVWRADKDLKGLL